MPMSDYPNPLEDRSLGGDPVTGPVVVDSTGPVTPEDFDVEAFLAGMRPTRRSVKLYPSAHLVGRMEEIAGLIEAADPDASVDDLIDEFEACKAAFRDGQWWTVEKRSSEWINRFRADAAKALGLDVKALDDPEQDLNEQRAEVVLRQVAAQVVVPSGVTYETLRAMIETNEGEVNKLIVAVEFANTQLAESAKVLTLDFSQRRSGNRAQRRSSKR